MQSNSVAMGTENGSSGGGGASVHQRRHSHSHTRRMSAAANFRVADEFLEPTVMKLFKRETSDSLMGAASISTVTLFEGEIPVEYLRQRVLEVMQLNPWLDGRLVKMKNTIVLRFLTPVSESTKSLKIVQQPPMQRQQSQLLSHGSSLRRWNSSKGNAYADTAAIQSTTSTAATAIAGTFPLHHSSSSNSSFQQYEQYTVKCGRDCVSRDDEPIFRVTAVARSAQQFALVVSMSHVIGDGHTFYSVYKMLSRAVVPRALIAERENRFNDEISSCCEADEKFLESTGAAANFASQMFGRVAPVHTRLISSDWLLAQKRAFTATQGPVIVSRQNSSVQKLQNQQQHFAVESNKIHGFNSSKRHDNAKSRNFDDSLSEQNQRRQRPQSAAAAEESLIGIAAGTDSSTPHSSSSSTDSKEGNLDDALSSSESSVTQLQQGKPIYAVAIDDVAAATSSQISQQRRKSNGKSDDDRVATPTAGFISTNDLVTSKFFCLTNADVGFMAVNFRKRIPGLTDDYAGNYEGVIAYQRGDYESPALIRKSLSKLHRINSTGALYPGFFARWRANISVVRNWASFYDDLLLDRCVQLLHAPLLLKSQQRAPLSLGVIYMQAKSCPVLMTVETPTTPAMQLMMREGVVEDGAD